MGNVDALTKKYLSRNEIFADALNYFLYNGEERIKPGDLRELDTTEIVVPYGTDLATAPEQRFRDVLKSVELVAMATEDTAFVIAGIESQEQVHYAMPVKTMLYDSMQYAKQVEQARKSYRKDKVRLSPAEFLSGFRKEDQLIPVVTIVILFDAKEWDGPRSIKDMLGVQNEEVLSYIPDYWINLIQPAVMDEKEFEKFRTGLGPVLLFSKHKEDENMDILGQDVYHHLDIETAQVIKEIININENIEDYMNGGTVDMCKAMENDRRTQQEIGRKAGLREGHMSGLKEGRESGLKEGHMSGLREGRESGLMEGRQDGLSSAVVIINQLKQGAKTKDIAEELGVDVKIVEQFASLC